MITPTIQMSLRKAALIAGFVTLAMILLAPFAELYAYPTLVMPGNASATVNNIVSHQKLFAMMMMAYTLTFIGDIIAAWALYILLKPVNFNLSALAAIFRIVFAILSLFSLLNLT